MTLYRRRSGYLGGEASCRLLVHVAVLFDVSEQRSTLQEPAHTALNAQVVAHRDSRRTNTNTRKLTKITTLINCELECGINAIIQ